MSDPQEINNPDYASVCSTGWLPEDLTEFLIDHLRNHFSATSTLENHTLDTKLWNNSETSNILIESITRWRPEMTEARPGILVKRDDIENERLAIGDHHQDFGQLPVPSSNQGYATWWTGSHTIFCLDREGTAVEILAGEVFRDLMEFSPLIRQNFNFYKFSIGRIGAIFKVEESKETFGIPITIKYAYDECWQLVPNAPLLKRFKLALS